MLRVSCGAPGASASQALAIKSNAPDRPTAHRFKPNGFRVRCRCQCPALATPARHRKRDARSMSRYEAYTAALNRQDPAQIPMLARARFPARGSGCDCRHATGKTMTISLQARRHWVSGQPAGQTRAVRFTCFINASRNAPKMAFSPSVSRTVQECSQWLSPQSALPSPAPQVKSVTRCCSASPMATCWAKTSRSSFSCSTCRRRKAPSRA